MLLDCPEFFSAPPLCAVALLAVNDALLKATFHNALTGKLSDLAGCFMLPLFISAVLSVPRVPGRWRLGVGALLTTAFFAAIKLSDGAADQTCVLLAPIARALGIGGKLHIVADPTDLIALVMVPLSIVYARRAWVCAAKELS